jgi:predicted PhzF superfamily epimerase YddE/YHI9
VRVSTQLNVLRVFVGDNDSGGNPLGVFLDGPAVSTVDRQSVAADLGFSETVFVDDPSGRVEIYTPTKPLPFAGHPLVGTGWLLAEQGRPVDVLRPPAGAVPTWVDADGNRWIRGRAEWAPPFEFRQYDDPAELEALTPPENAHQDVWAWLDEPAGVVRSRVFVSAIGIAEDEATGAAAVRLVTQLGRPILIRQGVGSVLHARPGPDGTAEVGGLVVLAETRDYPI